MGTWLWVGVWIAGWTGEASAREHRLHPVASGVSIPHVLALTPLSLEESPTDYQFVVEIRNDTDQGMAIPIQGVHCIRGELETGIEGRERPLRLSPYEARRLKLKCEHGRWVEGDFGLVLPQVVVYPAGQPDEAEVVAEEVVWRLGERDIARYRQRAGSPLATLSWRPPTEAPLPAEAPEALPAEASIAPAPEAPPAPPAPVEAPASAAPTAAEPAPVEAPAVPAALEPAAAPALAAPAPAAAPEPAAAIEPAAPAPAAPPEPVAAPEPAAVLSEPATAPEPAEAPAPAATLRPR